MLDALGNLESFQFVMAFGSTVLHIKSAIHKKSKISLSVIRFARRSVKTENMLFTCVVNKLFHKGNSIIILYLLSKAK